MILIDLFEFAGFCLNWVWVNVIVNMTKLFMKHWWLLPTILAVGFVLLIVFLLI